MKRAVALLVIFLSLISCAKKNDAYFHPQIINVDTIQSLDTIHRTYLALGDSYTIGSSVTAAESFPEQTMQLLKQQNINISAPEIIAVNGWTTLNLLSALNIESSKKDSYTFVTLLIGVNNQYRGGSLDEYKTDFTELLTRSISFAGNIKNHVFVLSIPDYSVTPFARGLNTANIASEIDIFNAANKLISLAAGVNYIDVTSISREARNDLSLIAGDGLHPSGLQYKKWSQLLARAMVAEID